MRRSYSKFNELLIIYKIWFHLVSFIKVMWFKILWHGKFSVGKNFQFRKGFTLLIMSGGGVKIGDNVFFKQLLLSMFYEQCLDRIWNNFW